MNHHSYLAAVDWTGTILSSLMCTSREEGTSYKVGQTKHEKTEAIGEKNHKNWNELEHGDNKLHWITLLITDKNYNETIHVSAANEDTNSKQHMKLKGVSSYPVLDFLLNILAE